MDAGELVVGKLYTAKIELRIFPERPDPANWEIPNYSKTGLLSVGSVFMVLTGPSSFTRNFGSFSTDYIMTEILAAEYLGWMVLRKRSSWANEVCNPFNYPK